MAESEQDAIRRLFGSGADIGTGTPSNRDAEIEALKRDLTTLTPGSSDYLMAQSYLQILESQKGNEDYGSAYGNIDPNRPYIGYRNPASSSGQTEATTNEDTSLFGRIKAGIGNVGLVIVGITIAGISIYFAAKKVG